VYYCQGCDDPHLMEYDGGIARCPALRAWIPRSLSARSSWSPVIDTSTLSPSEVADAVAAWVRKAYRQTMRR
jgi:hypothetical protein